MTENEYKALTDPLHPFTVRCTRCKQEESFESLTDLQAAMYNYMMMTGVTACPPCGQIILDIRRPHMVAAFNAAVEEINAYHAEVQAKAKAKVVPALSVVGPKGDVH